MKLKMILLYWFTLFVYVGNGQDTLLVDQPGKIDTSVSTVQGFMDADSIELRYFRGGYKEKYGSDDFNYKEKKEEKSAFIKFLERLFRNTAENTGGSMALVFIWLIRIILLLCILYGVYVLVSVLMGKEGTWFFKKSDVKRLTFGMTEEDIAGTNYQEWIQTAVKDGDFRSAVRYYYLFTLQKLSGKGHIDFHKDKTNTDYRYEIKDKKLAGAFGYVSYIYDHAWYGAFYMDEGDYRLAAVAFDDTIKMI